MAIKPDDANAREQQQPSQINFFVNASPLIFKTFRGRAGFLAIASEWSQVLETVDQPDFFYQYAWHDVALQTWPQKADDTYFIVAYRGARAVAICPLQLTRTRMFGLRLRTLAPPDPNSVSYSDLIYARTQENAPLLDALIDDLRSSQDIPWDVLLLPKAFETAAVAPHASYPQKAHCSPRPDVCFFFRCDQGIDALTARISKGLRADLRRRRKQLSEMGKLEFVWSRDPAVLPDMLSEFLSLEASGWKGSNGEGTAIKLDPALIQFYSGMLWRFAESGSCEINLLRLDGRNIAGKFCLLSGSTWNQLKIAYDEGFEKYSPGYVLLEEVLGRLCADKGVTSANLLTGAQWAERWHSDELKLFRIVARSNTLTGRIAFQEMKLRRFVRNRALPGFKALTNGLRRKRAGAKAQIGG